MNKNDVLNSDQLKRHFCYIHKLPINVYENPYFYQRIVSLDKLMDSVYKFDVFCSEMEKFSDEYEYIHYYRELVLTVGEHIRNSQKNQEFLKSECPRITRKEIDETMKSIYKNANDGHTFIAITMDKPFFSALHHYSPAIFDNANTWEDFVEKFTDMQHIIDSRMFIEDVELDVDELKEHDYEYYLMNVLARHIKEHIPQVKFYSISPGEIFISVGNKCGEGCGYSLNELRETIHSCEQMIGDFMSVHMFDLVKANNKDNSYLLNSCINESPIFIWDDSETINQVVKYYYGEPIADDDLVFDTNDEGKLARFLKPIDNPFDGYGVNNEIQDTVVL